MTPADEGRGGRAAGEWPAEGKAYTEGTHRAAEPADTLARLRPLLRAAGITRVAVQTGLDVLGIPVAAAYRPNSRSIAVHQGKGATLEAAKVSAIMEAVECHCAETADLPLRLGTAAEIGASRSAADPRHLPATGRGDPASARTLWAEAEDLAAGGRVWVPFELVGLDMTAAQTTGAGLFQATTNGLAAGNTRLEAVLHALYEAVERDATACWRAMPPGLREGRALDLDSVTDPGNAGLLRRFARAGVAVAAWEVTSDLGIPAFLALAVPSDGPAGVEPELGSGCHADRDVALSRALTEAAQARVARISGARDDFLPESYGTAARAARHAEAATWRRAAPARDMRRVPTLAGPTLRHDLDVVLRRLDSAGLRSVACVDLTRADLGIPVARVVVPGLEGPWMPDGGEYVRGARARQAASRGAAPDE